MAPRAQQIVEQSPPINKEKPKEAKHLSAENQKVEEETRSKNTGQFNNDTGIPSSQHPTSPPQNISSTSTPSPPLKKATPQPTSKPLNKKEDTHNLSDKDPPSDTDTLAMLKQFIPRSDLKSGHTSPNKRQEPIHSNNNTSKGRGPSASRDYLKDVKKGAQTLLNTHEFIYYSYYQRIRVKIQNFWEPFIRKKIYSILSQGRAIASSQNRITKTIIVLNSLGELITVQVISESGIRDLDEAAVEAFRAAEPFPNPPKGIADANGQIKIRWDFILEM